ncbi:MAG: hypothetical protein IT452_08360 [Planctomycetia bacterium]|nr:hypothetical protein [Planctomycetia bacterium]
MTAKTILSWDEAFRAGPRCAGGKGWNLGRLVRYGFPVPDGFVVTADAYREALASGALRRLAAEFAGVGAAEAATAATAGRLEMLRRTIEAAPLDPELAGGLREALAAAGLSGEAVAVRSSATAEDGGSASFAGVHRSVLDVRGPDAVLRAVREVWASIWTPQALAYRRRFLIADADCACAVVVCRMVAAKAAGVAFTCDPRTGRRDVIAISAARGGGEAVVSGAVNPEETAVVLTPTGLEVRSRTGPPALPETEALALARLAHRVAWALGDGQDPQDIEWAHDGSRFHILQARPVTRAPRVTLPGSAHHPPGWSNANIRDAVPFVMTAMTWSCVLNALRFMIWAPARAVGYPVPDGMEVVRRFHGRGYFEVTSLQWGFYDCFGSPPAEVNRSMGGHHEPLAVPPGNPFAGRRGRGRLWRLLKAMRLLLRMPKTVPVEIERVFRQARELLALDWPSLSDAAILAELERLTKLQVAYGEPFMLTSSGLAWLGELEKVLEKVAPGRGPALAAALVAGSGSVVSAQQGTRLFDAADAARSDPAALEWLRSGRADWTSLPESSPFRREFARVLADFGHRAVYEAEVATPRWNEDPAWLLEQVRAILAGAGKRPDEAARARREEAEREVRARTFWRRPQVGWLAKRAREAGALRERAKSALVAQVEPMRRALLEVGRRLVEKRVAGEAGDVFHLAWPEVEALLRGEWDGKGLQALVADRRALMERWQRVPAPDVVTANGGTPARAAAAPAAGGTQLAGMAVSPGRASGKAVVVRHPSEGARLGQGDVLVAPSTDPGWTPLFLRASAIVMETGGMLSHGAIVAREYGLPAVVNIPGLLGRVRDGERLDVDGDAGTVTVVGS